MFKTSCPHCKRDGHLTIETFIDASGTPRFPHTPLTSEGFETGLSDKFVEKYGADTSDEQVNCGICKRTWPLTEFAV